MKRVQALLCLFVVFVVSFLPAFAIQRATKTVRIAAFDFYPSIFKAADGSIQGFDVDFIGEVAKREGWNIEYVYGSWTDGLARVKKGEVDVATNVAYTEERGAYLDYTKAPLLTVWAELYVPRGSKIVDIREVRDRTVGVMRGDFNAAKFRSRLEKFGIPCKYREYGSFDQVFRAVAAREVDGGVANSSFGTAKLQEYGLKSAEIVLDPFDIYFAVAKGQNQQVLATLDRYLTKWRQDESSPYHEARKRWSHGNASAVRVVPPWLRWFFLTLVFLAVAVAGFIWALRTQVRRKTAELESEVEERRKTAGELHLTAWRLEEELAERQVAQEALQEQTALLEEEVAEHVQTAEALRESELRFRTIFDTSTDAIFIHDPANGAILDVNQTMCDMYGYHYPEALARSVQELSLGSPPYSQAEAAEFFARAMAGEPQMFEWHARHQTGRLFWVEYRLRRINIDGNPGLIATVRDISERKLHEMRMTSLYNISQYPFTSEQDFLDHALHEVLTLTQSGFGYIYFYNEHKRQFVLISWSEGVMDQCRVAERNTVYNLDSTGLWGEAVRQRRAIMVNDFGTPDPLRKGTPEGHVPLERFLTIPLICEGRIVAVVGVANKQSDYTDSDVLQLNVCMDSVWKMVAQKRADQEHARLEQQLLHAQKLESLGVLAGGIAHDFNNILMTIIGNADLAMMRLNKESPGLGNLRKIEQAAAQAADLAKQMLAYSGKGKFVIESIDLNRLLEEMLHLLEVSISKKAVVRINPAPHLPAVEADSTQLRQVVMNLVINASEAIGDKSGVIAITTGYMDCDRGYLKDVFLLENLKEGLYVYLEVADTGCGMDRSTMGKIFDPFFTTKFTGRGLGMAAVMGIVRGHHGAIKVYSEPGKGTTFKILLPASSRPAELFSRESSAADAWRGSGIVLLVDDEETVRGIGKEMLQELGFTVLTANDGREAVRLFKAAPDIRLVILDLTMPHMDGVQCFRELRQLNPEVRVIMSSGYNEQEVTQKFVGKGLSGFIQKPYNLSVLRSALLAADLEG